MDGLQVKLARITAGIKQYDLAAMVGVPQSRISMFENGKWQPPPEILERIIQAIEGNGQSPDQEGG